MRREEGDKRGFGVIGGSDRGFPHLAARQFEES